MGRLFWREAARANTAPGSGVSAFRRLLRSPRVPGRPWPARPVQVLGHRHHARRQGVFHQVLPFGVFPNLQFQYAISKPVHYPFPFLKRRPWGRCRFVFPSACQFTALATTEPILVNTLLTTVVREGMAATAATATMPAARAYSTRSCPLVSFQNLRMQSFIVNSRFHLNICVSRSYQPSRWNGMRESA